MHMNDLKVNSNRSKMAKKRAILSLVAAVVLGLMAQPAMAEKWHRETDWGWAAGHASNKKVTGTVADRKGDGACVQVITKWYSRGYLIDTDYSPQACPKGDKDTFTATPGDGAPKKADWYVIKLRKL
jgi:hypothetical protein